MVARMARARDRRRFGSGPFVVGAALRYEGDGWPFDLPAVRALPSLRFDRPVTFLVGENGSGKSTLVEAIAWALGFDAQGGTTGDEMGHRARGDNALGAALHLELSERKPREQFFLRAESFFNFAGRVVANDLVDAYGGVPLHEQSHGESFLALAESRFGGEMLYILDEPEAALSVTSALAFMAVMHRVAAAGAQFIVATHSPILLALPGARIYELWDGGASEVSWEACDPTRLTRAFLEAPERFLHEIVGEAP
jgi:predicted ATPase